MTDVRSLTAGTGVTDAARVRRSFGLDALELGDWLLRPLAWSDFNDLYAALSESPETNWARVKATSGYVRSLLRYRLRHYAEHGFGVLGVYAAGGELVGQAGLQVFDSATGSVEVVLFLRPGSLNRGVGSVLLGGLLARAAAAGVGRVYAAIRDENVAAQRFFERFGFHRVGAGSHFSQPCGVWVKARRS